MVEKEEPSFSAFSPGWSMKSSLIVSVGLNAQEMQQKGWEDLVNVVAAVAVRVSVSVSVTSSNRRC